MSNPLSDLDKTIEKLMYNRIIKFLEEKKICYKQFGFCNNFSAAYAIITLMENIQKAFDDDKFPYMYMYVDICVYIHVCACIYVFIVYYIFFICLFIFDFFLFLF